MFLSRPLGLQGSRWLFQATRMDGSLGFMSVKPDQIGIVNPLLIIAITPLFNSLIYPCFKKCGLLTPLQRIGTGGMLIGISFVISGIVELNLEVYSVALMFQSDSFMTIDRTENVPSYSSCGTDSVEFCKYFTMPGGYFIRSHQPPGEVVRNKCQEFYF